MSEEEPEPSEKTETGSITVEELIRSQLQGKSKALERYDAILWKIRSGYIVVLYGGLTILAGKESILPEAIGTGTTLIALFYLATGISVCALFIDLGFLLSKLRVIEARDRLSDLALNLAFGHALSDQEKDELRKLLHLSGAAPTLPSWSLIVNGTWTIVFLYPATPALLFILSR
jgi:hypothetical protein